VFGHHKAAVASRACVRVLGTRLCEIFVSNYSFRACEQGVDVCDGLVAEGYLAAAHLGACVQHLASLDCQHAQGVCVLAIKARQVRVAQHGRVGRDLLFRLHSSHVSSLLRSYLY